MSYTDGRETGENAEDARTLNDTFQGVLYLLICLTGLYTLVWNWNVDGFATMLLVWVLCGSLILVSVGLGRVLS